METKTIIYLVAAALVLRVVIRTIIKFLREGREANQEIVDTDANEGQIEEFGEAKNVEGAPSIDLSEEE